MTQMTNDPTLKVANSRPDSNLFDHMPENLFSILAGPLKDLHASLLLLIYDQNRRTIYTIPRETVIDLFCEYLESSGSEELLSAQWFEEDNEEIGQAGYSIRDRSAQMLRKFIDAQWVIQEQNPDYTFKISLPDYSLLLLETLDKIRTGYRMEFRGRVLSVYQNLTGEDSMSYVALQQAQESTAELIKGLTSLNHSIKKYTEKLLQFDDPYRIISQIFDEYQTQILGEQYYRLKTSENISKYRTGILSRVKEWQVNRVEIVNQARRMVEEKQAQSSIEGENRIYGWLDYIEESFTGMDEILSEIDHRNKQYARSAVEKLRFQLQQGRGVEQHLVTLLRHLSREARQKGEKSEAPEELNCSINIFPQQTVDELSVKMPTRNKKSHNPQPLKLVEIDQNIRTGKLRRFQERMREEVTVDDINRYVDNLLEGKETLPLSETPLQTRDHWVKLIYILLYSRSRRARYQLTGTRGGTVYLDEGKIGLPALTIVKWAGKKE